MFQARLEQALILLAQRHAPKLVPPGWRAPGDYLQPLSYLAGGLSGYNLLVLCADLLPSIDSDEAAQVSQWVQGYIRLYDLLAQRLFPSFAQVQAYYVDQSPPPIVCIQGAATPVIVALAKFIAPYVVVRQRSSEVSDFELIGLMDMVLEELEAGDLPREQYRQLCADCAAQVRQLLKAPVRQRRLTEPHRAMRDAFAFQEWLEEPEAAVADTDTLPVTPLVEEIPPEPPPSLPEDPPPDTGKHPPAPPETPPFGSSTPIFFDPKARNKRKPPVPGLPGDES